MALKTYKPTSPGVRSRTGLVFDEVTKTKPEKSLLLHSPKRAGRNSQGKITVRHRGGGSKQRIRMIDYKRDKVNVPGKVAAIEYDPNRTANIALIYYADGDKRYILSPMGLKVGEMVKVGEDVEIKPGNALPMRLIPTGTLVHCLELKPGKGGQIVRSAGTAAQLVGKEEKYVMVRLPSGEVRRILGNCIATVGQVGNADHQNIKLGKAGRTRLMGLRPTVRGSVMNPRDHPHGGGEGKAPRGMPPKTPWGKPALGKKTRRNKESDRLIVKKRD